MDLSYLSDLTPRDLDLPAKFKEFRAIQVEGMAFGLYGKNGDPDEVRRFHCMGLPTGSGKSALTHALGKLGARKYVVCTATRSLEDQQINDRFDLANVRGRANYPCTDPVVAKETALEWRRRGKGGMSPRPTCQDGYDNDCSRCGSSGACTYSQVVQRARSHPAVLTNYQYWMNTRAMNNEALEGVLSADLLSDGVLAEPTPIDMFIGDEAHLIPGEMSRYLGTWVSNADLKKFGDEEVRDALEVSGGKATGKAGSGEWGLIGPTWLGALGTVLGRVVLQMVEMTDQYGEGSGSAKEKARVRKSSTYRHLDKLRGNIERVVTLGDDNNWLWRHQGTGIAFDCIWPSRYAERYLWSGIKHIVLMSATLRPKSLDMSGVKTAERWYKEWPRVFPKELSPVFWVPTGRMGWSVGEEEKYKQIGTFNEMARLWEGQRGIVHTPSYDLAEYFYNKSAYGRRIVLHKRGESAAAAADKYRATPGAILASPSFHTGHDFSDEACAWQFIPKLPFPSKADAVVQARCESDPSYYSAETMQRLVQTCGRGTRHDTDTCVTVISDDMVKGFRHYARDAAPAYFKVIERKTVPGPDVLK